MRKNTYVLLVLTTLMLLLGYVALYAQYVPYQWTESLIYLKDERTQACFAMKNSPDPHYGPYFTYVPCDLVQKADWFAYEKKRYGIR